MANEIPGLTVCPDCEAELSPAGSMGDPPGQYVPMGCGECGTTVDAYVCQYPGPEFVSIGHVAADEQCGRDACQKQADIVTVRSSRPIPEYRCRSHLLDHYERIVTTYADASPDQLG